MDSEEQIVNADDEMFEQAVLKSDVPVFVDFWAPWCAPCLRIAPIVEELAEAYRGSVKFVKVNVDKAGAAAASVGISSIPTLALFNAGEIVARKVGVQPKPVLKQMIEKTLQGG